MITPIYPGNGTPKGYTPVVHYFTKEWVKEYKGGLKNYNKLLKEGEEHLIEKTGERLRSLMPWVPKRNIKGAQAAYAMASVAKKAPAKKACAKKCACKKSK